MSTEWVNPPPPDLSQVSVLQLARTRISNDVQTNGATIVVLVLPDTKAGDLMTATTDTATTPPAAACREVARPIGLALQEAVLAGFELP